MEGRRRLEQTDELAETVTSAGVDELNWTILQPFQWSC